TGDGAYGPFGEVYAQSPNLYMNFTGANTDLSSSLYDMAFREYHPTEGRWLTPDPGGLAAVNLANPQSLNRYAYVTNNPTAFTDPLGLQGPCPSQAQQAGICSDTGGVVTWYPPGGAAVVPPSVSGV